MSVLLLHAHEEARVAPLSDLDRPLQAQVPLGHDFGQALQLDGAFEPTCLEYPRVRADVGDSALAGHWRGLENQDARIGGLEPKVYRTVVAGGDGLPGKHGCALLLDAAIEVPIIDHRGLENPVASDGEGAVPGRGASSPPIFGALVDEPHAAAKIFRSVGPHGLDQVKTIPDVDPFDRRSADHLDRQLNLLIGSPGNVAHDEPKRPS